MKILNKYIIICAFLTIGLAGCEEYLDLPPEASLTEQEIFSTYDNFQGFIDPLYEMIVDYSGHAICVSANLGGENFGSAPWNSAYHGINGIYWDLVSNLNRSEARSIYRGYGYQDDRFGRTGIWDFWGYGSRLCNIALDNLELLEEATQEQKNIIEGQALFFRAFLHWEIARAFGTIPYLDKVLEQNELKQPRHWEYKGKKDWQAVAEKMVEDLDAAAALLPEIWDPSARASGANEPNYGRITKGACHALKAKVLLYAGSPLMNEASGNAAEYETDYMNRAAEAAYEVIKLANKGVYILTPFANYQDMFATTETYFPTTNEVILERINNAGGGLSRFRGGFSRTYSTGRLGGNAVMETPTQNFVDKFEMSDGTRYIPGPGTQGGYDDDSTKRWENRDPRFDFNFYTHGEVVGTVTLELHVGGEDRTSSVHSPYYPVKFRPDGVDDINGNWGNYKYVTPQIRLADIYLVYAEALFEATGDANSSVSGATLTAVDAVNLVRNRAGMPPVTATPAAYNTILEGHGELSSDPAFRRLLRNERAVEFYTEGHYWFDTRRWKIALLLDKNKYRLDFDENVTYTSREVQQQYIFTQRHYWVPFPIEQTQMYAEFEQNPGW